MSMLNRPQIDEVVRRQLLDNYLKTQQIQSTQHSSFHPSQFQSIHPIQSTQSSRNINQENDTMSDVSRISFATSHATSAVQNNIVRITEHNTRTTPDNNIVENSIVPFNEMPENISVEDFSNLVKKWIEIDNWLKKQQEIAKQKRKQKDKISEIITHYMCKYNIEDLNTSEGKIRCKVRYVKSGINQKVVKQRITELFKDNEEHGDAIISKIFNEREKVERVSLRRLKIT
jgi:hypothetical protein